MGSLLCKIFDYIISYYFINYAFGYNICEVISMKVLKKNELLDIIVDSRTMDSERSNFRLRCPESGYFKGYKKCFNQRMVTLLIPKDAGRSSATSNTCRCSKARVLEISNLDRTKFYTEAYSYVDSNFVYRLGEMAVATNYNEDRWSDSTGGIHFYMTWDEAAGYM